MMYIKRDIEGRMSDWKKYSRCALEIEGSRQVGKTTVIEKFVHENFKNVIMVNLDEESGGKFIRLADKLSGSVVSSEYYLRLVTAFAKEEGLPFTNDGDTVLVIDEIQNSKEVYEMVRPFNRYLGCRVIVTGSYLGKAKNFFQPAGDTEKMVMYPISFLEFVGLWDGRAFLEGQDLLDWDSSRDGWFQDAYSNYVRIGGYPELVRSYFENGSLSAIGVQKQKIQRLIMDELRSQLSSIADWAAAKYFLKYVALYAAADKTGRQLIKGLTDFISHNDKKLALRPGEVKNCLNWLLECGILDTCSVHNFTDILDVFETKVYFRDIGVFYDVLSQSNFARGAQDGILAENFVFKTLNENFYGEPNFGKYNNGEIDFVFKNGDILYGIEVKSGKNVGRTAMKLLQDRKINKLVYFKGNTHGGVNGDIITLPIWASAVCKYDFVEGMDRDSQLKHMTMFK